jgi:hypothetical protein
MNHPPVSLPGFGVSVDFGDQKESCEAAPPSGETGSRPASDSGQQDFDILLRFFDHAPPEPQKTAVCRPVHDGSKALPTCLC